MISDDVAEPRKKPTVAYFDLFLSQDHHGTGVRRSREPRETAWPCITERTTRARHVQQVATFSSRGKEDTNPLAFGARGKTEERQHLLAHLAPWHTSKTRPQACCSDRPPLPCSTQGREHGEALAVLLRKARTSAKGASAFPQAPRRVRQPESITNNNNMPRRRHALPSPPPTTAPPPLPRRQRPRKRPHRRSNPRP